MAKHPWAYSAILILWLSLNANLSADLIVSWNLHGEPGDQISTTAAFSASNVIGNVVARGAGLNAVAASNSINSSGWNTLDSDDYFSFGFTVDPGYRVNLDQLLITTRSSNTGPGTLVLRYGGDGFTDDLTTFTQQGTDFLDSTVDLTALTNLTGDVEFRLFSASTTSADGGTVGSAGTFRITNYQGEENGSFRFTGTVEAIPEPSSLALLSVLGVGASGLWLRRRIWGQVLRKPGEMRGGEGFAETFCAAHRCTRGVGGIGKPTSGG
jgi:hypothetical protein